MIARRNPEVTGDYDVTLTLSLAGAETDDDEELTVRIIDTSVQPNLIVDPTRLVIDEHSTGFFRVGLQERPSGDVSVEVDLMQDDASTDVETLVFTRDNWQHAQHVPILGAAVHVTNQQNLADISFAASGGGVTDTIFRTIQVYDTAAAKNSLVVPVDSITYAEAGSTTVAVRLDRPPYFGYSLGVPVTGTVTVAIASDNTNITVCLLYTSPSPRDRTRSRMPSSA